MIEEICPLRNLMPRLGLMPFCLHSVIYSHTVFETGIKSLMPLCLQLYTAYTLTVPFAVVVVVNLLIHSLWHAIVSTCAVCLCALHFDVHRHKTMINAKPTHTPGSSFSFLFILMMLRELFTCEDITRLHSSFFGYDPSGNSCAHVITSNSFTTKSSVFSSNVDTCNSHGYVSHPFCNPHSSHTFGLSVFVIFHFLPPIVIICPTLYIFNLF